METTTDSITATRFDVEYAQVYIISPMGDGGECLHREGQFYHFQNGSVWPGFGFPRPDAYTLTKTGTITARPCFYWRHQSCTEMVGRINEHGVELVLDKPKAEIWVDGALVAHVPCNIRGDGFFWPDSMYDLEHKIIDIIS